MLNTVNNVRASLLSGHWASTVFDSSGGGTAWLDTHVVEVVYEG